MELSLGSLIREARRLKRLKQKDLAAKLCISNWYLCQIEIGKKYPSELVITRLAGALDLERAHLMLLAGRLDEDLRSLLARHGDLARLLGDLARLDPTPREMAALLAAALEQVEAMRAQRAAPPRPPRRGGIA